MPSAARRLLLQREKHDFLAALGENGLKAVSAPKMDARRFFCLLSLFWYPEILYDAMVLETEEIHDIK